MLTGVSKQTIMANVLLDLFNMIGPENYRYNSQTGFMNLFGTYWRVLGANDEGAEKYVRGMTAGFIVGDELTLLPQNFFDMLMTRMSPEGARFYGSTNPDTPRHYIKANYLDNEVLRRAGKLASMHCTMDDNPNLPQDFKDTLKATFKGLFYRRYILGEWVMAEGAIWRDAWSEDLLYDDSTTPIGLYGAGGYADRWISVDVGVDHPQVYLEWFDDDRTIWLRREWIWDSRKEMRQKTDAQYADDLEQFMGPNNSCQIRVPPEAASFKAELEQRGLWVVDADNEVAKGIQTVSSLMAKKLVRVHRSCTETIKGIELYAWDPNAAKRGEEKPLKKDDDNADAFRYGLHGKIPIYRYSG